MDVYTIDKSAYTQAREMLRDRNINEMVRVESVIIYNIYRWARIIIKLYEAKHIAEMYEQRNSLQDQRRESSREYETPGMEVTVSLEGSSDDIGYYQTRSFSSNDRSRNGRADLDFIRETKQ